QRQIKSAVFPLPPLREGSLVEENVFRFLNVERSLSDAADWNDPSADRLWLYNLHYFDDLNAAGRGRRRAWHERLIARWITENPPGFGAGWEPYPLSLRIVNWIKWEWSGFSLSDAAVHSLAVQARYLRGRLEYHLLGNHLLANAKALVFAGLFFEGDESRKWLDLGLGILESELTEQILADGGHFERSPMYHSIVFGDVLDLLAMSRVFPSVLPPRASERWTCGARRRGLHSGACARRHALVRAFPGHRARSQQLGHLDIQRRAAAGLAAFDGGAQYRRDRRRGFF